MKKLLLLAALGLSTTSAFARYCEVHLVDLRRDNVLTVFRSYDAENNCRSALRECHQHVRETGMQGRHGCVSNRNTPPSPVPVPTPNPYPYPYPGPSNDAQRPLFINERVIVNNKFQTVVHVGYNQDITVRSTDGWDTITKFVRRENVSVTNGCNVGICVNDTVFNINSAEYVEVEGLSFDNTFVTSSKDGWNTITSRVQREDLAETNGCAPAYRHSSQICVGHTVLNNSNREATVIGIQLDGRVVLQSRDGWNNITTNVDPSRLIIIR